MTSIASQWHLTKWKGPSETGLSSQPHLMQQILVEHLEQSRACNQEDITVL